MALRQPSNELPRSGVPMTEEEFLRLINGETSHKYELVDGMLYDMTGSSPKHSSLAGRVDMLFQIQMLRAGPCRAHRDQYVAIPGRKAPVCPDVVLTCDLGDWDEEKYPKPFRIHSPLIVVEVLSPGTEAYDRAGKFELYQACETLEVYILANQFERLVEVYRREMNWQQEIFHSGQTIHFDQMDLELAVDEIYEGILA